MFGNKLTKIPKMVEKNQAEKLEKLLTDKDMQVKLAAVDGLGQCTGDVAFNALVPLINHPEVDMRVHTINALGMMGLPKARTFLLHRRDQETDAGVNKAIAEALHRIEVRV